MISEIYLYLVVALSLLWVLQKVDLLKKNWILILSGLSLAFVLALRNAEFGVIDMHRYSVYYDAMSYANSFNEAIFHSNGKDMGYWALVYLASSLGISFQLFCSLVALFNIWVFLYYIKKHSIDYVMSCFILLGTGCFTFMFYGLRQAIAMSLVLLCLDACFNKKIWLMIIWAVLAFLIHWSAVAIIPLLFVSKKRFNTFVIISYFFALVVMILFSTQIGYILTVLFSEEYVDHYESSGSIGGLGLLYLMLLAWFVFVLKRDIYSDYKVSFFLHAFMILCMIQISSAFAYAFTRLNFYYTMSVLTVTVPMSFDRKMLKLFFGQVGRILSIVGSVTIIILMIILFNSFINGNGLNDFIFFWEEL